MAKTLILVGLIMNLIASIMIGYGKIFRSKKTIEKESQTGNSENKPEKQHRLLETRIAQVGAALLAIGFAVQIWGNVADGWACLSQVQQ